MHQRKMNFITGSPAYADAHLVSSDGLVIPFHRIIFHMSSQEGKLAGCELELYINSQWRDNQVSPPTRQFLFALLTVHEPSDSHPYSL